MKMDFNSLVEDSWTIKSWKHYNSRDVRRAKSEPDQDFSWFVRELLYAWVDSEQRKMSEQKLADIGMVSLRYSFENGELSYRADNEIKWLPWTEVYTLIKDFITWYELTH